MHRMKAERLQAEFAPRRVPHPDGLLLLRAPDAVALVNRAAEEGVPILGVDGFVITPVSTESPIEHIADYASAVAQGHGCWEDAESFIRKRAPTGMVFELTLGDDPVAAV